MLDVLLWTVWVLACVLLVYPYLGYGPLLAWLARRFPAPAGASTGASATTPPKVTLIISAYNEAEVIAEKLRNAQQLDYPAECLEILVVSDASDDGTDDIVRGIQAEDERIRLLRMETRGGKTRGLNRALTEAGGELVVFSDANAIYKQDALRELVGPFSDSNVGYVVGAQLYVSTGDGGAEVSEGLYWRFELWLKQLESSFHSVVGGDGAIYAIRRELFWPLRDDDINDFVNPLQIVAHGYRGVFNQNAICYEEAAGDFAKEFRRKRRIVNRSFRAYRRYAGDLRWGRDARFRFCLMSHKVVRWFSMFILATGCLAGGFLVLRSGHWLISAWLLAVAASLALAAWGRQRDRSAVEMPRLVYLIYYFYLINLSAALGIYDELRGVRHVTWDHVRGGT